jgi:glycosyltransferase involved in cell wall biosynthesis
MWRLHKGLREYGIESTIACRHRHVDDPSVVLLPAAPRLERSLGRITWRLGLNDVHCVSTYKIRDMPEFRQADIVNIHGWHTNYLSYRALPALCEHKPVVGTMHDMWCLTGHCAMSLECERWRTGCGSCPHLDIYPRVARDATAWTWKMKHAAFNRCKNLAMVSPSRWLLDLARQSMLGKLPLHQIENCVDTEVYRPLDREAARRELGVPLDRRVIMFCSVDLESRLKGGDLFVEAIRRLPEPLRRSSTILLVGNHGDRLAKNVDIPIVDLGFITCDHKKALAYNAADLLVMPSRYETQGLVVIEAMSCGTPAVAFETGGLPEVIRHGPGGRIARFEDINDLCANITELLEDDALRGEYGAAGRQSVLDHFSVERHVARHIELFQSMLT